MAFNNRVKTRIPSNRRRSGAHQEFRVGGRALLEVTPPPPPFDPFTDPNLDVFLESDTGVTNTAGRASAWADRTANAHNFASGTGPTIIAGGLNGKNILRFANEKMDAGVSWAQASAYTVYAVIKVTNSASWRWLFGPPTDGTNAPSIYAVGGGAGLNPEPVLNWGSASRAGGDFPTDINDGAWHILRWTYEGGATGKMVLSRDWRSWCRSLGPNGTLNNWGRIGTSSAGFQLQADLASLVGVARAVTKAEHLNWLQYLGNKWGITQPAAPVPDLGKIWCIGDSLTLGYSQASILKGGFRRYIWNLARVEGVGVEFVGTHFPFEMNGGFIDNYIGAPDATYGNPSPDNEHDGDAGATIANLQSWVTARMDALDAATDSPNKIVVLIGTNDVNNAIDLPNAPSRLDSLLVTIHARYPNAAIIVCTIPPFPLDATKNTNANTYNAGIASVVTTRQAQGWQIRLADVNANIVGGSDLEADGIHLKSQPGFGYEHAATPIYNALKAA